MARRTIADVFREEGRTLGVQQGTLRARQETLVMLLQDRFGALPEETTRLIENTRDLARLKTWARRVLTVKTLDEIGITAQP